jgi:hypothetical protein
MRVLAFTAPLLAWIFCGEAPRFRAKPDPPIKLNAKLTADDRVVAHASSPLDAEIELSVLLSPDHAPLRSVRARRPVLELATGGRRNILIRATLVSGTARFTRVIPLCPEDSPPRPAGTLRRNARGEAIREFEP